MFFIFYTNLTLKRLKKFATLLPNNSASRDPAAAYGEEAWQAVGGKGETEFRNQYGYFFQKKTAGKLVFFEFELQYSVPSEFGTCFHVISNKPMNGFSWMHGTVLLIPARLYSLHNR